MAACAAASVHADAATVRVCWPGRVHPFAPCAVHTHGWVDAQADQPDVVYAAVNTVAVADAVAERPAGSATLTPAVSGPESPRAHCTAAAVPLAQPDHA